MLLLQHHRRHPEDARVILLPSPSISNQIRSQAGLWSGEQFDHSETPGARYTLGIHSIHERDAPRSCPCAESTLNLAFLIETMAESSPPSVWFYVTPQRQTLVGCCHGRLL